MQEPWNTILSSAVIVSLLNIVYNVIRDAVKDYKDKKQKAKDGADVNTIATRCLLRDSLRANGLRYIERGSITLLERGELAEEYEVYHKMGGNGLMTALIEQVNHLPIDGGGN